MSDATATVQSLREAVAQFRDERDWKQFHTPKDLAISISIEAGELLELFQWKTNFDTGDLDADPKIRERISEEIADVVIYCLSACEAMGIDLSDAILDKLLKNEAKYPTERARGNAKKYTEYE